MSLHGIVSEQHNSSCALDIKTFFRDVLAPFMARELGMKD